MNYNLQRYVKRYLETNVRHSLRSFPVTALLGPRQCGKSTLARRIVADMANISYLDLEKPSDLRKLDDAEFFFQTKNNSLSVLMKSKRGLSCFPLCESWLMRIDDRENT